MTLTMHTWLFLGRVGVNFLLAGEKPNNSLQKVWCVIRYIWHCCWWFWLFSLLYISHKTLYFFFSWYFCIIVDIGDCMTQSPTHKQSPTRTPQQRTHTLLPYESTPTAPPSKSPTKSPSANPTTKSDREKNPMAEPYEWTYRTTAPANACTNAHKNAPTNAPTDVR